MSSRLMTPPRSSTAVPRRRSTPFTARPAIQSNCRRCHEALSGPTAYCWMCGASVAGVRWTRLAFHAAVVSVAAGIAVAGWLMMGG